MTKEFIVKEYLTVKLEDQNTVIYVACKLFGYCMYLMLDIPVDEIEKFDAIESIDEAADILGWTYDGQEGDFNLYFAFSYPCNMQRTFDQHDTIGHHLFLFIT